MSKPVYDWQCMVCGAWALDAPAQDNGGYQCPLCGAMMDKKWNTAPTVLFNGTGWTPNFHNGGKKND